MNKNIAIYIYVFYMMLWVGGFHAHSILFICSQPAAFTLICKCPPKSSSSAEHFCRAFWGSTSGEWLQVTWSRLGVKAAHVKVALEWMKVCTHVGIYVQDIPIPTKGNSFILWNILFQTFQSCQSHHVVPELAMRKKNVETVKKVLNPLLSSSLYAPHI